MTTVVKLPSSNNNTNSNTTSNTLFINNDDWEVTKEIYANSVIEDGIIDIEISLHDIIGIRRVIVPTEDGDEHKIQSAFEYCILSDSLQLPVVRLTFQYSNSNENGNVDNEYDNEMAEIELDSVNIEMRHIPPALSLFLSSVKIGSSPTDTDTDTSTTEGWIEWLSSNANDILNETKLSFSICDFIEHQAISYFDSGHKDDRFGYSSILFDEYDRTDPNNAPTPAPFPIVEKPKYDHPFASSYEQTIPSPPLLSLWMNSTLHITPRPANQHEVNTSIKTIDDYAIQTIQQQWSKWLSFQCPICFETELCSNGIELPCQHFLCMDCTQMYIQSKISELNLHRHSPFICPIIQCKKGMKLKYNGYKNYYPMVMSKNDIQKIEVWKLNLTHPLANVLTICPRKKCKSNDMRQLSTKWNDAMVFCNTCHHAYCELCMSCTSKDISNESQDIHYYHLNDNTCDEQTVLKLCRRYRNASLEIQAKADEKWHWLKDYASARNEDFSANAWVSEHASKCPNCRAAIERSEGCFHMHCTLCGTHFCYECGDELHPPYYGTHHCWEEGRAFNNFD